MTPSNNLDHKSKLENYPQWQKFNPNWPDLAEDRLVFKQLQAQVMASHMNELIGQGLVMAGWFGCGKTLLLSSVTIANGGLVVKETSLKRDLEVCRDDYSLKSYAAVKVLFLDDIGVEHSDAHETASLKDFYVKLLRKRKVDKSKKTYFATNCLYAEKMSSYPPLVERVGEEVVSLMLEIIGSFDNWIDLADAPSYCSRNFPDSPVRRRRAQTAP